jgi:hypothetical protein
MLLLADRLKMSITELNSMTLEEYNTWLGYLLDEHEQLESQKRMAMHR